MRRLALVCAVALLAVALAACSEEAPRPILVQKDRVSVINMTGAKWTGVDVWLNDHYRAQAPELLPGQRLDIPIGVFIAGFGQRFDPKRQAPFGVEVEATGPGGERIRLVWGRGRRR